jgi:hypothetical protein
MTAVVTRRVVAPARTMSPSKQALMSWTTTLRTSRLRACPHRWLDARATLAGALPRDYELIKWGIVGSRFTRVQGAAPDRLDGPVHRPGLRHLPWTASRGHRPAVQLLDGGAPLRPAHERVALCSWRGKRTPELGRQRGVLGLTAGAEQDDSIPTVADTDLGSSPSNGGTLALPCSLGAHSADGVSKGAIQLSLRSSFPGAPGMVSSTNGEVPRAPRRAWCGREF